jgi:hypothetical protein
MKNLIITLLVLSLTGFTSNSTDDRIQPLPFSSAFDGFRYHDFPKLIWSLDSQKIFFNQEQLLDDACCAEVYDLSTQQVETVEDLDEFPYIVKLTEEEQEFYEAESPYVSYNEGNKMLYESGLTLIFAVFVSDEVDAARKSQAEEDGSLEYYSEFNHEISSLAIPLKALNWGLEDILWSADGQTLVLIIGGAYGGNFNGVYYFNISPQEEFDELRLTQIESSRYVMGVSSDGSRILIPDPYSERSRIRLWQMKTVNYEEPWAALIGNPEIAADNVIGANFIADDADTLLIATNEMIAHYHIPTAKTTPIITDKRFATAQWVKFSPDNQYAVMSQEDSLYLVTLPKQ